MSSGRRGLGARGTGKIQGRWSIWFGRLVGALLVAVGSVGIFVAPAIAEPSATYQVRPGDTLSGIAQEYGVTVDSLARANDLNNPNLIWAGQTLRVSAVSAATAASAPLSPFNLTSLIEAPYYSQFDGSVWAESNCGPTALAMALGAVGRSAHPLTLRTLANRQMGSYSPYNGTTWEALAYAARQYGATPTGLYQGRYYRQWTTNALMSELAQKHPVLLLVRYRALPDHQQSSYYGDHYIVALGYDRQGNLIYNDPAIHGDGSDRTLTPSQLANAWGRTSVGLIRSAMALH